MKTYLLALAILATTGTCIAAGPPATAPATPPPPAANDGPPPQGDNPPPPPPTDMQSDHDVYHVLQITDAKGNTYGTIPGGPRKTTHVDGTIKTLNYDRMGNVNGAVLD